MTTTAHPDIAIARLTRPFAGDAASASVSGTVGGGTYRFAALVSATPAVGEAIEGSGRVTHLWLKDTADGSVAYQWDAGRLVRPAADAYAARAVVLLAAHLAAAVWPGEAR